MNNHQPTYSRFFKELLAGTTAGITSTFFGHPLDTIKVQMQTSKPSISFRQCTYQILRLEGVRGLFKGLLPPIIGNIPIQILVFGGN